MNVMKAIKLIFLICIANNTFAEKINLDRIIAIVGDGIIMESQLLEAKKTYLRNFEAANTDQPLPPETFLEEQILENLIIQELQLQRAFRAGVRISDQELNESMSLLASNNNLTLVDFKKEIESQGDSYEKLREDVKKEMIIARVQRGIVGPKVFISEQELNNFINSVEGQNFDILKNKNDQSRNVEETLTWKRISNIPTLFTEIVKEMQLGEYRGPIESGAGFHILYLKDKRGDTVRIEDQVLARHILIQTSEVRSDSQAKKLIEEIKEKLSNGEAFEILARLYSDDPGSKLDGGELGWSSTDKYAPAFKKALDEATINEVTPPFKSAFGWHIAEVLDRRKEDISSNIQKNKAYRILFERKFQEQLETTLQEMRSESFVEIKKKS